MSPDAPTHGHHHTEWKDHSSMGDNSHRRGARDQDLTSVESLTDVRTDYVGHAGYRFAILTLANAHHRPVTMGPASLANFEAAVRALDLAGVDAVAVTGTGPVFCAGADLKKMTE